jgi:signal transduction histidine kinase
MARREPVSARSSEPPGSLHLPFTFGQRVERYVHEGNAIPLSVALAVACAAIDYTTGADVIVNFLYQVPIFLGTWFRRWTGAAIVIAAAMAGRFVTMRFAADPPLSTGKLAWNTFAELCAFNGFALFILAIRTRARATRTQLLTTTEQLRHAERLTTLGKLAAGVAHELGTPLNVLMVRAEMLTQGEPTRDQVQSAAQSILKQGERMTGIVRQLLDFGRRAGAGRERADLRAVARAAAQLVDPAATRKRVSIEVDEGDTPVLAEVNSAEMEQVVGNLLLNAIQASPEGARVRVAVGTRSEGVSGRRPRPVAFISVEDHGEGITPEHLPHIFDPFFTTKDVGEGTGLGLSVSFGIVTDHGGNIDVASRPGAGSKFTVLLPV